MTQVDTAPVDAALHHAVSAFLFREARLLDDREWDAWLECYAPDARYWMPAWTDDDRLTQDPMSEMSLIFYASRQGLEDRVYRLRTQLSSASSPQPRTCHMIANVEVIAQRSGQVDVRYNWHTLSHRMQVTDQFFGTTHCTIDTEHPGFRIAAKTVILKDDYISQVIDIYHV
jgi:benzoate/toluate 1,2-dioxygenase subunit beta